MLEYLKNSFFFLSLKVYKNVVAFALNFGRKQRGPVEKVGTFISGQLYTVVPQSDIFQLIHRKLLTFRASTYYIFALGWCSRTYGT